jgi:hypothetical protein
MNKTWISINTAFLHAALLLTVAGLAWDIYLRVTTGGGICPTEACVIVGDYIRISELNLVLLGLAFFAVLWGVFFFASRYSHKWLWGLMSLLLLGALSFDGAILGFQYFSIKEQCHLCFGVGAALLVILMLLALVRKKVIILTLGLTVWLGGAVGGAILNIPDKAPQLEELAGITLSDPEAQQWPRFHYFFSLHCPHCTDVLINLAVNEPRGYKWNLLPLDTAPPDLRKIAWVMDLDMKEANVFYEIVRLEQSWEIPDIEVPEDLVHNIGQIRAYFRESGFRGVPLMIVDENPGRRLIITGGAGIISYLEDQGIIKH